MEKITLTVNKADVYDEVAKTTSYTGAKMQGDAEAYERIFTTDADHTMLERFWTESCNVVTDLLKRFLAGDGSKDASDVYEVTIEPSISFDMTLRGSMEASLFSYFVNAIVSKWFKFTNREETVSYEGAASKCLLDVKSKLYYRKKPLRPTRTKE